ATIGIQGRIDAIFREGNRLDILELKTGMRLRPEDHAQLFIYRLLLSDLVRRWQRNDGQDVEITTRLLSSIDGSFAPLRWTADLLDDSRLEFRVKNFRTIRGARIVSGEEPFTFEFEENTSDMGCGDTVLIHAGRISSSPTYHGLVREAGTKQIRVSIPLKNLAAASFEAQSWIIDRFPSDVTAEASHTALYDFLVAPMDEKKKVVLGFPSSQRRGGATAEGWSAASPLAAGAATPPPRGGESGSLNSSQIEAIR